MEARFNSLLPLHPFKQLLARILAAATGLHKLQHSQLNECPVLKFLVVIVGRLGHNHLGPSARDLGFFKIPPVEFYLGLWSYSRFEFGG
jgi:hypothetical protein